jgi:hypothetical protein
VRGTVMPCCVVRGRLCRAVSCVARLCRVVSNCVSNAPKELRLARLCPQWGGFADKLPVKLNRFVDGRIHTLHVLLRGFVEASKRVRETLYLLSSKVYVSSMGDSINDKAVRESGPKKKKKKIRSLSAEAAFFFSCPRCLKRVASLIVSWAFARHGDCGTLFFFFFQRFRDAFFFS